MIVNILKNKFSTNLYLFSN